MDMMKISASFPHEMDAPGWISLFPESGPLWLNRDPLHPQIPLCRINFRMQPALKSCLVVCSHLSLSSEAVSSLGIKRTGNAYERLTLREALCKWTNTIQNTIELRPQEGSISSQPSPPPFFGVLRPSTYVPSLKSPLGPPTAVLRGGPDVWRSGTVKLLRLAAFVYIRSHRQIFILRKVPQPPLKERRLIAEADRQVYSHTDT